MHAGSEITPPSLCSVRQPGSQALASSHMSKLNTQHCVGADCLGTSSIWPLRATAQFCVRLKLSTLERPCVPVQLLVYKPQDALSCSHVVGARADFA